MQMASRVRFLSVANCKFMPVASYLSSARKTLQFSRAVFAISNSAKISNVSFGLYANRERSRGGNDATKVIEMVLFD